MSDQKKTILHHFITTIKKEVENDNLSYVLKQMKLFFKNSHQLNEIIAQQGRLSNLANKIRLGIISYEDQRIETNQIRLAILELLDIIVFEANDDSIGKEIENAISIVNNKNVVSNSQLNAQKIHVGDKIYHLGQPNTLDSFKKSLLAQQKNIFKQYIIKEGDDLYIPLPKQKRVKETLSYNNLIQHKSIEDLSDYDIETIFHDKCFDAMLILGAPGSGKSTLLTELGYAIASATEKANEGFLPIFLNLTSWSTFEGKKSSDKKFWDWLFYEAKSSYGIRGKEFEDALISKQIVLLLDGLDEVAESQRKQCLLAFNAFIFEHRIPVALTCRKIEYQLLCELLEKDTQFSDEETVLRLNGAIEILPISELQMLNHLKEKKYTEIEITYQNSKQLRNVLNSPLWLSIAVNSYKNGNWKTFDEEPKDWKYQLMEYYEDWILDTKLEEWKTKNKKTSRAIFGKKTKELDVSITHWMSWLAFIMTREQISVFYLERIQPWYLPDKKKVLRAYEFSTSLALSLINNLCFVLPLFIILRLDTINNILYIFLKLTLVNLLYPYLEKILYTIFKNRLANGLSMGINYGLIGVAISNIKLGIFSSIIFGLLFFWWGKEKHKISKITIIESFRFDMNNFNIQQVLLGLSFGLVTGIAFGLSFGLTNDLTYGVTFGSLIGFSFGISIIIGTSLEENFITVKKTLEPNQGVHRTLRYSLLTLVLGLSIPFLFNFLPKSFQEFELNGLSIDGIFAIASGVLIMTLTETMGFLGYINHFIIRRLLQKENYIPKKYISFLNVACRLGYLRRVGGGYRFFHKSFQEYLYKDYKNEFRSKYTLKLLMKGVFEEE